MLTDLMIGAFPILTLILLIQVMIDDRTTQRSSTKTYSRLGSQNALYVIIFVLVFKKIVDTFAFLHIPKCGGSSIEKTMRNKVS